MNNKVYLLISSVDYSGERKETIEAAFLDKDRAEVYMHVLETTEQRLRNNADRCQRCDGNNHDCPLYLDSFYESEGCDTYEPWHDPIDYRIEEVKLFS